jgi:large subunit ribosomal protein L25
VAEFTIEAEKRTIIGKQVNRIRAQGLVPITVYGAKIDPISLQVPYRSLEVALLKAGGTNLIDLKVNGETHVVLVREVQRDILKGTILHADFFVVDQASKIRAEIPIHLIGESPVVAAREGILLTGTNTVTVETLPGNLMDHIEVDLATLLELGDSITVADLDLGDDVTIINEPEDMLARVAQTSAARAELLEEGEEGEEEEELEEGAEPEVISRGRAEEEDEE